MGSVLVTNLVQHSSVAPFPWSTACAQKGLRTCTCLAWHVISTTTLLYMRFCPWYVARFRPRALFLWMRNPESTVFVNCFIIQFLGSMLWLRKGVIAPDSSTRKFFCQFFAKHRLLLDISRHHHLHDLHHQHGLSLRLKVSTSPPTSLSSLSPASFLSSSSPSPPSYII